MSAMDLNDAEKAALETMRETEKALIPPETREFFQHLKGQLLIAAVRKFGVVHEGETRVLRLPAAYVDQNAGWILSLGSDGGDLVIAAQRTS